jgi:hypothetical protein
MEAWYVYDDFSAKLRRWREFDEAGNGFKRGW